MTSINQASFEQRFEKSEGCWLWQGALHPSGYAMFGPKYAARISYELYVGPIPTGCEIDHTCHNFEAACAGGSKCLHRRCVNPAHLKPVTHTENMARVTGGPYPSGPWTHCAKGHPQLEENRNLSGCAYCAYVRALLRDGGAPKPFDVWIVGRRKRIRRRPK